MLVFLVALLLLLLLLLLVILFFPTLIRTINNIVTILTIIVASPLDFYLNVSFLSPLKNFYLLIILENLLMKRDISLRSYPLLSSSLSSSSSSSLELSSTTFLLLLFLLALKAMSYFLKEMIPLDKLLKCWASSTSIS
jgi:predicted PurR-regulated permease PerM